MLPGWPWDWTGLAERDGRGEEADGAKQPCELGAEGVHPRLQRVVEHVADHDHAALRPLAHAAEVGVVELRLASSAGDQRREQLYDGALADAVALRDVSDDAASLRG